MTISTTVKEFTLSTLKAINSGIQEISQSFSEDETTLVIFAGIDPEFSNNEEIAFGIYMPLGNEATWLPAVTSDRDVMLQIQSMESGQSFIITDEENDGGLGVRVNALEIDNRCTVYPNIDATSKPFIQLG